MLRIGLKPTFCYGLLWNRKMQCAMAGWERDGRHCPRPRQWPPGVPGGHNLTGALDGEAVDALAERLALVSGSFGGSSGSISGSRRSLLLRAPGPLRETVDRRNDHAHGRGRLGCWV